MPERPAAVAFARPHPPPPCVYIEPKVVCAPSIACAYWIYFMKRRSGLPRKPKIFIAGYDGLYERKYLVGPFLVNKI